MTDVDSLVEYFAAMGRHTSALANQVPTQVNHYVYPTERPGAEWAALPMHQGNPLNTQRQMQNTLNRIEMQRGLVKLAQGQPTMVMNRTRGIYTGFTPELVSADGRSTETLRFQFMPDYAGYAQRKQAEYLARQLYPYYYTGSMKIPGEHQYFNAPGRSFRFHPAKG